MTELKLQLLRFQINVAAISKLHPQDGSWLMLRIVPQTTMQFLSPQLLLKLPLDEQILTFLWSTQPQGNRTVLPCF